MNPVLPSIASILLLIAPAFADAPVYEFIKEKSSLKFVAMQNNAPVTGRFTDFSADIRFSMENPETGSISVEVNMGSVTTDYEEVQKNLKLPEWLSAEAFPKATFKSASIIRMPSSDNYYAEGELTLRGKTVPIVLNFHMKDYGETSIAEGSATLKRNDFGIGQGEWVKADVVKNEVRVEFRITAKKK